MAPPDGSPHHACRFALVDPDLRNSTKSWLSAHLLWHLLKPDARLAEHLCQQRRVLGLVTDKCKIVPKSNSRTQQVLSVQLHLYAGSSSMKHYVISIMRLLAYTGARLVVLVPTNPEGVSIQSAGSCDVALAALNGAIRRQSQRSMHNGSTPLLPANLGSVKVSCLSQQAGLLYSSKHVRSAPPKWSIALYYLSAALLLSEGDFFLGSLDTDFAKIVHHLMQARPYAARAARASSAALLSAFDILGIPGPAKDGSGLQAPVRAWVPPSENLRPVPLRRAATG